MQLAAGHQAKMLWVWIAAIAYIALNTVCIALEFFYLPLIPAALLFFLIAFTRIDILLYIIVFFAPLSIHLSEIVEGLPVDVYLPTEILLAALLLVYVFKYLSGERMDMKILRHPVSLAIYFNLAWMAITVITSSDPLVSLKFFVSRLWFIIGFYILAIQIFKKEKNMHRYIWLYVISFSVVIVYTIVRHSAHGLDNQVMAHSMMQPFYKDHTSYGATLAFLLPVLMGFFALTKRGDINSRFLMILLILVFIAATVFSYTRAAWVSLIAGLAIFIVIRLRIKFVILSIAGMVLIALFFVFQTQIMIELEGNRQKSSGDLGEHVQSISNVSNDQSNLERINRWSCAYRMWKDRPIFGYGPGTFQFEYGKFQRSFEKTEISTDFGIRGTAHSEYLGPLSESGVLGMLSMLIIVLATIFTGIRVHLKAKSRSVKLFSLGILIGLITYYIHGVLNNFLDTDKASALFWGFTAMLVAMDVFHKDTVEKEIETVNEAKAIS
ncbi:O-antigen ligase family protein [Bacteroidota bacterium]